MAQTEPSANDSNVTYSDIIYVNKINGINIEGFDTFNLMVDNAMKQKGIKVISHDYPKAYFTNQTGDRFLKIWAGPDFGYGWFYTIGYTNKAKCSDCGIYLGKQKASDFIINDEIKLGEQIKDIWPKAHLEYFRSFKFKGNKYFYFEKGVKTEVPFVPYHIYYYKFKDEKLIEIGFGYGMRGTNPMLQPE